LLEELVANFDGTLLLVSHDRAFLDNVVTGTLIFGPGGVVREFVGGYTDSMRQWKVISAAKPRALAVAKPVAPKSTAAPAPKTRKLSYKDQRELDSLPSRISELETEQTLLNANVSDPGFYNRPHTECEQTLARLHALDAELQTCLARWEALENSAQPIAK
jgi:ATP-binding cassette subfamily F protein uup